MTLISIHHRYINAVLYSTEVDDSDSNPIGTAVRRAVAARANLGGAYLGGADLAGANLAGANLGGAYLADSDLGDANLGGANLADADLGGANLACVNLADADLGGANLARANLADANLADANLAGADLAGAYLADADIGGANLGGANLVGANLAGGKNVPTGVTATSPSEPYVRPTNDEERIARYRARHPEVPIVERLDARILRAITEDGGKLNMSAWHTCETTHCRAGWAITIAGEAGHALERQYGPQRAGAMIYRASTGRVPWFFAPNDVALEDIKRCAAEKAEDI